MPTIAVIGAGNMGVSLIGGLIKHGHAPKDIWASDIHEPKLAFLHQQFQVNITIENEKAIENADVVIFAIKPQYFAQSLSSLATVIHKRKPLIISIAAGIRIKNIRNWLQTNAPIIRAMPNTPALIGAGVTALYAEPNVSEKYRLLADNILGAVGVVVWIPDEALMDVVTALSGSGPAYFYYMMEALNQGAESLGLPPETARLLILETGLGAIKMAIESGKTLAELRKQVTSPGGTTQHALDKLDQKGMFAIFAEALYAAKQRGEQLAEQFGEEYGK